MDLKRLKKMLGRQIRIARYDADMTQLELAEAIGITPTTVSQWERGREIPSLRNLLDAANAMNIPLGNLFEFPE